MKKIISSGYLLFLGFSCLGAEVSDKAFIHAVHKGAKAMMTFYVLDNEGHPVEKAAIKTGFDDPALGQSIYNWQTDTNGVCVVNGNTRGGMWFEITKPDFYTTEGNYYFRSKAPPYVVDGKWNPWNPTNTVVLKKVKNPVPMYVKSLNIGVPEFGKLLGFDLEKGDWVSPYGKGVSADFLFSPELVQRSPDDFDYTLTLTFPNKGDGIKAFEGSAPNIGSQFKSDYEAPSGGYLTEWKQFRKRRPKEGETNNIDENRIYYFRVRTKLDEHGNIISALYGKIYGDFLQFTYYLNPTSNDRNIEFDPEKNLFGGRDRFAP